MSTSTPSKSRASLAQPCAISRLSGALAHASRLARSLPSGWAPEPPAGIGRAQVAVAVLPHVRDLRMAERSLGDAVDGSPASPEEVIAVARWLIAAYPTPAGIPSPGLIEALAREVDDAGLSAPVLAAAALAIVRRETAPPQPAALIREAHRVRREADDALRRVVSAIRVRTRAEAILAAAPRHPRHRVLRSTPHPARR